MQYGQRIDVSCVYAFCSCRKTVDSIFVCGEGWALFSLKFNNTFGNKIEISQPFFFGNL